MTLVGGAATAWPLAARAQQPAMPVIGMLNPNPLDSGVDRLRGFRQGLKDTGLTAHTERSRKILLLASLSESARNPISFSAVEAIDLNP